MDPLIPIREAGFRMRRVSFLAILAVLSGIVPFGSLKAELIVYRNSAAFTAAIAGRNTNLVNFDATALGTEVANATFQGLTFGSNPNTSKLWITDGTPAFGGGLRTFSPSRFLGSDAGELITLATGQSFSFGFQANVSAVGFYFISDSQLRADDGTGRELGFRIGTTTALIDNAVVNGVPNEIPLTGGGSVPSFAYFVGIVDTNPLGVLSSVTVIPNLTNAASFGIDNITTSITAVPEPTSILLAGIIVIGGVIRRSLRTKRSITMS